MATQLYARIRRTSKYAHQNQIAQDNGCWPFPVELHPDCLGYCVKGGPGGQYTLKDVHLFALDGDDEIKLT